MGVEQHLVRLQQIGPQDEGPAVGELEVGDLQLGPLAADDRPVLPPVELERLAGLKRQRHEGAAPAGLLLPLPLRLPLAREGRHAIVGAVVAEGDQIGVQLLDRPLLLARLAGLRRSMCDSLSANGSSLLGRSGTLNFGSTLSERRYLRIVFRDSPVRRAISRIEKCSRNRQRRMTLNNSMSITPLSPAHSRGGKVRTWVNSRWKNPCCPGQLSVEINRRLSRCSQLSESSPISFSDS